MTEPTFSQQMVTKLQGQLLALAGVKETQGDGERAVFADLKKELAFWERRVARESGAKPVISAIEIGGV